MMMIRNLLFFLTSVSSALGQVAEDVHEHHHDHRHDHAALLTGEALALRLQEWEVCLAGHEMSETEVAVMKKVAGRLEVSVFEALPDGRGAQLIRYAGRRVDQPESPSLCWAPDTEVDVLEAFHAVEEVTYEINSQSSNEAAGVEEARQISDNRRWSRTAVNGGGQRVQGLPITLTWSIVPDGTTIPSFDPDTGAQAPSNLRARLASVFGGSATGPPSEQPWFSSFEEAFANISGETGLTYIYEPNDDGVTLGGGSNARGIQGVRGDVRISGRRIDGNGSVLAFNFFPSTGDMVIDTEDNFFSARNLLGFRNVIEHEHGHGLGLPHVCPVNRTKLMEPFVNTRFRGIQFDDIYSIQRLYGDFFEKHHSARNNDSIGNAAPLEVTLDQPYEGPQYLSIDDDSDRDFFLLPDLSEEVEITFTVTPSSQNYLEGPQGAQGCSAGTDFDSNAIHNLQIAIIGTDGSTVLQSRDSGVAGEGETITGFQIPAAGSYYLRVLGDADVNRAQLYEMQVSLARPIGPVPPADPSNLIANTSGDNGINLRWADNSNNETGFRVERRTESAGDFVSIATVGSDVDSYPDNGASPGVNYFYQIVAINQDRESGPSNRVNALTIDQSASLYRYDLGLQSSPLSSGAGRIFPNTRGDISWNGSVSSRDRAGNNGFDFLDRDFIFSSSARVLEHEIANGLWQVTFRSGDADVAHDQLQVSAEGQLVASGISSDVGEVVERSFLTTVNDGGLTLRFADGGGSNPDWVINALTIEQGGNLLADPDNNGLDQLSEFFFGIESSGSSSSGGSQVESVSSDGRIRYKRRSFSNVTLVYEMSTDLTIWTAFTPVGGEEVTPLEGGMEEVQLDVPVETETTFVRFRLTAPQ